LRSRIFFNCLLWNTLSIWTDPKEVDAGLLILLAVVAAPQVRQEDGDGEGEQEGAHRVQPVEDHHQRQALQHGELDYLKGTVPRDFRL
jgi:hypothetical protein